MIIKLFAVLWFTIFSEQHDDVNKDAQNSLCSRSVCSCIDKNTRQDAQDRNNGGGRRQD